MPRSLLLALCFITSFVAFAFAQASATGAETAPSANNNQVIPPAWRSTQAQLIHGLPEIKTDGKGTLFLFPDRIAFVSNGKVANIPRSAIQAVNAGNERVELWGMKGRLMRMMIPQGGGLVAASFMHHRVDTMTIEYQDLSHARHYAVIVLSAEEAQQAMNALSHSAVDQHTTEPPHEAATVACQAPMPQPATVLIQLSDLDTTNMPAAYRALFYEYLVDAFQHRSEFTKIYREGETGSECAQFTVAVSTTGFKQGNQVLRATTGPIGMLAAPTILTTDMSFTNTANKQVIRETLHSSIRSDAESISVAKVAAKSIVKKFIKAKIR